jgi:GAF domain-containing protein
VGIAVENVRLFEQTQTRAGELAVLNEMSRTLTGRLSAEGVLDTVYRGVSHMFDEANMYIALYDPDKDVVTFPLDITEKEEDKFQSLSADRGLTGYIIRNCTSVLIKENIPERLAEMGIEMVGAPALSWMGVPMMVGTQVLGVMAVQSYTTPRAFDEHDRELMAALANQTATALQNARLFEQTRARAERERVTREITDQIQRATDIESLMRIAAEELNKTLGASRVYVRMAMEARLGSG